MIDRRQVCLFALSVALLAGCSAGGSLKVTSTAPTTGLPPQPSARLVVNAVAPNADDVLADVRAEVLGRLLATGRFSKVIVNPEPTDLIITVDITKYSKVTVGERILVGVFAGRNRIGATVRVARASDNGVIKTYEASGESAAHPLSSEAGVSDALREAAKQIAAGAVSA